MFECPLCQAMMEEETTFVTACCGAQVDQEAEDEEPVECPVCGMEAPEIVEGETRLVCTNCGYSE